MRTFERTHPWITFTINLRQASPLLWIALGEAISKCDHLAKVPLLPATAKRLHQITLAKGVAATTAIEGNTLTEAEVLKAVEGNLTLPPSKDYMRQEVENIIGACNGILELAAAGRIQPLSIAIIKDYNRVVLTGLPPKEDLTAGEIRTHSVGVGNVYRGAPAEDCDYLLERLCAWLAGPDFKAPPGLDLIYAIIKAVVAHLYLAWIHPFGDGNGRTARLLEFHLLLAAGISSPAAHLLSNHYNETRTEYYRQLDLASKSGGDIVPFISYAVTGFVDGLRAQLESVWEQAWYVTWRNFVHESFSGEQGDKANRQRRLLLDLGERADWVDLTEVATLTPQLAKDYGGRTSKTLQRDINDLELRNLVERDSKRVRARREIILSYLPPKRRDQAPS